MISLFSLKIAAIAFTLRVGLASLFLTGSLIHGEEPNEVVKTASALPALKEMPSFDQRDEAFEHGGLKYCGPTAAANALMWLADQGYPRLKPVADTDRLAQREMIKRLANLMGVHRDGSTTSGFLCGVKSYIRAMGYLPGAERSSGQVTSTGKRIPPDLALLADSTKKHTVVWLGLGTYRVDQQSGRLKRTGGHLVTLARLTTDPTTSGQAADFLISDPEFPGAHVVVKLKQLDDGLHASSSSSLGSGPIYTLTGWANRTLDPRASYRVLESIQALSLEPGL